MRGGKSWWRTKGGVVVRANHRRRDKRPRAERPHTAKLQQAAVTPLFDDCSIDPSDNNVARKFVVAVIVSAVRFSSSFLLQRQQRVAQRTQTKPKLLTPMNCLPPPLHAHKAVCTNTRTPRVPACLLLLALVALTIGLAKHGRYLRNHSSLPPSRHNFSRPEQRARPALCHEL